MLPRRDVLRAALLGAVGAVLAACGVRTGTVEPGPRSTGTTQPSRSPTEASATPTTTSGMSLRQKIAGLLVVGFRGTTLDEAPWLRSAIAETGLGGVILFDKDADTLGTRNIESPAQLMGLIAELRAAAGDRGMIVSVDQEGGVVTRLSPAHGFPAVASEEEIGAGSVADAEAWAIGIATILADMGFNLNLAPVVDLNVNAASPAIGALRRSFSADPAIVVQMATIEIDAQRGVSVRTTLKHFPGIGSAATNTDFGVADVTDSWSRLELEPFRRLIDAGEVDVVMAGHVVNRQLDPDPDRPASLSAPTVTGVLRGELGWDGAVITDDLQATAIVAKFGRGEAALMALEAGCDLLLFANQQGYDAGVVVETIDAIVAAVTSGRLAESRIDEALGRVQRTYAGRGD